MTKFKSGDLLQLINTKTRRKALFSLLISATIRTRTPDGFRKLEISDAFTLIDDPELARSQLSTRTVRIVFNGRVYLIDSEIISEKHVKKVGS